MFYIFIYRLLKKNLEYKYTTSQILDTLRNMEMIEHKDIGYEPIYERIQINDDLHETFSFNTDFEITIIKKWKKFYNK